MSKTVNGRKPRNMWSKKEDEVLQDEVTRQVNAGRTQDWRTVAEKLPGRNNKDCRKRWLKLDSQINKGAWSEQEDQRLREALLQHPSGWTEVARAVGRRNADQCAKRWLHFVDPGLDHSKWTQQDDARLIAAVEREGHNWRKIVDEDLEGRSATDAKNRYNILTRRKLKSVDDEPGKLRRATQGLNRRESLPSGQKQRTLDRDGAHDSLFNAQVQGAMEQGRTLFNDNVLRDDDLMEINPGALDIMLAEYSNRPLDFIPQPDFQPEPHSQGYGAQSLPQWHAGALPSMAPRQPPGPFGAQPYGGSRTPSNLLTNGYGGMLDNISDPAGSLRTPPDSIGSPIEANNSNSIATTPSKLATATCQAKTRFGDNGASKEFRGKGRDNDTDDDDDDEEEEEDDDDDDEEESGNEDNDREGVSRRMDPSEIHLVHERKDTARTRDDESNNTIDHSCVPLQPQNVDAFANKNRESTMVLRNMPPHLVSQVMAVLFQSETKIDIKIYSQE